MTSFILGMSLFFLAFLLIVSQEAEETVEGKNSASDSVKGNNIRFVGEDKVKKKEKTSEEDEDEYEDDEETDDDMNVAGKDKRRESKAENKGPKIWDQWSKWSACSVTCGIGKITRWRHCVSGGCSTGEKEAQIKTCTLPAC